jgi:hypothetical protein
MSLIRKQKQSYRRAVKLIEGPAVEPVQLEDLKIHLRIDDKTEDDVLVGAIAQAREMIEEYLNLAMITQTWLVSYDQWPIADAQIIDGRPIYDVNQQPDFVELPRFPLASVTSVITYAADSTPTSAVVDDVFDVDTYSTPGRMALQSGQTWPTLGRKTNAIEIQYEAGYGAIETAVPPLLRRCVMNVAAYLYEHRGDCGSTVSILQGSGVSSAVNQYKIRRI